jgi:transcriptional regulator with XRE-family HTH domain
MKELPANKSLNLEAIEKNLSTLGLSQSQVADALGVSRQIVSQWLKGTKFPRPAKLLSLSKLLKLSFNDLVCKADTSLEPVVAFRKKGSHKITDAYLEDAKDKGYLLQQLVPCLPFDNLSKPPSLIDPKLDYTYIQKAAQRVREEIEKKVGEEINFAEMIDFFARYHAVIIPVFWGNVANHENALHVYLPSSMTTWIYLNLDSKIHDFKFWMAHELGHIKSPDLSNDESEDFADHFAGALLVGRDLAEKEYATLTKLDSESFQIKRIIEVAEELVVSPLTIYFEINRFAENAGKPTIDLEKNKAIYRASTNFQKSYKSVADYLFETLPPTPKKYVSVASEVFGSPFFDVLRTYLSENKKSVGFLQELLNLSPADTHTLYEEIC